MLKALIGGLSDLIFPPNCLLCRKYLDASSPNRFLCLPCQLNIKANHPPFCVKCSRHLGKRLIHPRCRMCRLYDPQFDFAWAACLYTQGIPDLIHQFKYYQRRYLRHLFIHTMIQFIHTFQLDIRQFDLLLPVPLHASRLRERGSNQSLLLAKGIADTFNIKILTNSTIRWRATAPQSFVSQKNRWTNIHGAFRINDPCMVKGKSILIVDDLLTTGATASELSRILKGAGVTTVGVFTLAITI